MQFDNRLPLDLNSHAFIFYAPMHKKSSGCYECSDRMDTFCDCHEVELSRRECGFCGRNRLALRCSVTRDYLELIILYCLC